MSCEHGNLAMRDVRLGDETVTIIRCRGCGHYTVAGANGVWLDPSGLTTVEIGRGLLDLARSALVTRAITHAAMHGPSDDPRWNTH